MPLILFGAYASAATKRKKLLSFFTGEEDIPFSGFTTIPSITFDHTNNPFPSSSTCILELKLPVVHTEYVDFETRINEALQDHGGFGLT